MQIENAEKLRKTTLRERIYEEVVHLILSGEIAKWRMRRREAGDRKTAGESNPVPRGDRDTCKGWAGRDQALSRLYVRRFSRSETVDLYELYNRLE